MNIEWNRTAESIVALGDRKENFLVRLVTRISDISKETATKLRAAVESSSGTAFAAAVEPLIARFEVYAGSEAVFGGRLEVFTKDVAREVERRQRGTTVGNSLAAQLAVVNGLRADLLQLAVDETIQSTDRALRAYSHTMLKQAQFKLEHALSFAFNAVEVAAAVTPGVSSLVHFASPALDTAKLFIERYASAHAPAAALEITASALDNLDALADAARQIVVSVYRLPATLNGGPLALLPIHKAELELAKLVAQHHAETRDVRVRERERQR